MNDYIKWGLWFGVFSLLFLFVLGFLNNVSGILILIPVMPFIMLLDFLEGFLNIRSNYLWVLQILFFVLYFLGYFLWGCLTLYVVKLLLRIKNKILRIILYVGIILILILTVFYISNQILQPFVLSPL